MRHAPLFLFPFLYSLQYSTIQYSFFLLPPSLWGKISIWFEHFFFPLLPPSLGQRPDEQGHFCNTKDGSQARTVLRRSI